MRSEQPLSHCGKDVNLLCETSISTKLIGGTAVVSVSSSEKEELVVFIKRLMLSTNKI